MNTFRWRASRIRAVVLGLRGATVRSRGTAGFARGELQVVSSVGMRRQRNCARRSSGSWAWCAAMTDSRRTVRFRMSRRARRLRDLYARYHDMAESTDASRSGSCDLLAWAITSYRSAGLGPAFARYRIPSLPQCQPKEPRKIQQASVKARGKGITLAELFQIFPDDTMGDVQNDFTN